MCRSIGAVGVFAWLWIGTAQAQLTNVWTLNANGFWAFTNNWSPSTSYPDSAGAVAIVTNNNTSDQTIYLTNSITLGTLLWGDANRANFHGLRSTNATVSTVTFDSGDGRMALFVHGTGDRPDHDFGRSDDRTDVGIVVSDPQGLFIDNWQNFYFRGLDNGLSTDPARAFDGGGNDVTKGEDGYLAFSRLVTNVATWTQRDGFTELFVEGNPALKPGISNLVLGVAPGTIDTGANPDGVLTNVNEGGAYDRVQLPYFSIIGAATTNGGLPMTNDMHVTFNRGIFRSLTRGVPNVSNTAIATLPVYTGTFTLNGAADESIFIIEHQNLAGNTGVIKQTIFRGPLTGSGGFTKIGTGEMTLMTNNDFTGALNINRAFDQGRGRYGGVGLRENGTLSGVSAITLNRDGGLYLDDSLINLSNRVNDAAAITTRGRSQIEMLANGAASSYERFGSVTTAQGSLAIEFDKADGSPQSQALDIASLVRAPGSIVGLHASDLQQDAFSLNGPTGIVVNLLDGGASLAQIGSGGGAGSSNRSVVVGVFGGDGADVGAADVNTQTPGRADEFMTVDAGRLRTLLPSERVSLGGRVTNALTITQASASSDANVNIDFMSRQLELGSVGLTNGAVWLADKRVVEDTTFNSIRLGIARGITANDNGRSLLIADGATLASESGMLLAGRDTGSATGDDTPNGNIMIYGGSLDLDGAANDREAIVQNNSGNSIYLRTTVNATQGFTKGGLQNVHLESPNNFGGVVNIAQGNLYVRDDDALRGATEVNVQGDGVLIMISGATVTNVDLRAGERPYGSPVLISETGHNIFGGDIMVENVDPQGTIQHDVRLRASANNETASLTILGDIGMTEGGASADINLNDSVQVSFNESGGILNLRGTFGDRLVAGEALPVEIPDGIGQSRVESGWISNRASTENRLLRFNIDGNGGGNRGDELNVNIYNPWNAAGRIYAQQGTIRYLGEGDFWASNAMAVANFAVGNSGFQLGGGGTDQNGAVTVFLTKDGQVFNAERWTVAADNNANNTVTMGLEHFGPSNATVTIGNNWNDINPAGDDNRITISGSSASVVREFRLFSHDGYDSGATNSSAGTVNVIQSIRGNDFSYLTTVGNGKVVLGGQSPANASSDEGNDIRNFMLLGGELVLDRTDTYAQGVRRTADSRASLTLAGGDLTYLGRNGTTTEVMNSNLTVRAGDSRVEVKSGGSGDTDLSLATLANSIVTRQRGGTVHFTEDNTAGGNAVIRLAGAGITVGSRIGSWATYGTNLYGGPHTWAATDASSNVVEFGEGFYSVDSFGGGSHVHLEVPSALSANDAAASLRYTNAAALDLGTYTLDVVEGGILVTPTVAGAASIDNGLLTSSGGELIIHNYADAAGSFGISAAITGAVDLTHSGSGRTVLTGANDYTGVTRLNGGTVEIDDASRLGSGDADLELRGGTLFSTANVVLSNRTVVLGGDGGTFNVAGGTTNWLGNIVSESNFLALTRMNNGHGDLIKTGAGDLNLTGSTINHGVTDARLTYQGLTDVREGTLRVLATNNFGLGASHSFYDGTIVRDGATLALGNNGIFGGGTGTLYTIQEWLMLEEGSTLRIEDPRPGYQAIYWNAPIDFRGDATIFVQDGDFHVNQSGAGYLMGDGDLIKDGDAALNINEQSPDFTGGVVVKDGTFRLYGVHENPLPNMRDITLGLNDTTNRGGVVFYAWTERDGYAGEWDINQDIAVQGFSTDIRLGVHRYNHNDVVNYNGDIDLTNFGTNGWTGSEFRLTVEDELGSRTAGGADEYREDMYMNLNGDITGGDKRIRTLVGQSYYSGLGYRQTFEPEPGNQLTNEMNMMVFFTMTGSNTGWTGSLEVGNRPGGVSATGLDFNGPDQDKQHFMRFGRNDGAATMAIGANNGVVLRHDATLQAHGSQVTIGNLFSDGNSGGSDGYFGSQLVSNTFVENGGTVAGSLTVVQTSNRVVSAVFCDGTYYSPTTTNLASAALSLIKDGTGILALNQSNYYTGTTTMRGGLLNVDGTHVGGGLYSVLNGGGLGGTGIVVSEVRVFDGGALAPGSIDAAGGTMYGSLTIDGNLSLSNASVLRFDLAGNDITPGGDPSTQNDLVHVTGNLTLDGVLEIAPSVAFTGPFFTNSDFWTLFYYEGALTDNVLEISAASQALVADDGYMFYVYSFEGGLTDEIRLGLMVPEPSIWVLLAVGLGLVGWASRRRVG